MHKRKESLGRSCYAKLAISVPWLCFRDFNEIMSMEENMGNAPRSQRQMVGFRNVVNSSGFKGLEYTTQPATQLTTITTTPQSNLKTTRHHHAKLNQPPM